MMDPAIDPGAVQPSEVQVGGPVDSSERVYITRDADREFTDLLRGGEFVNVVTSRQMGKTSLVYHAMLQLGPQGYRFAYLDLSPLRTETNPRIYFQSIVRGLARELEFGLDLDAFWAEHAQQAVSQAFIDFFRRVLDGTTGPVVVVLDEIDSTLELEFTDDLFTAIRSIYTSRPRETAFKRLTFCLVGVATPNELIKTRRTTPYNIGRTIWLSDFDPRRDTLEPLARTLSDNPAIAGAVLERILYWTGGQPYLTAWLCEEMRRQGAATPDAVDAIVEQSFVSLDRMHHDSHFEQTLRFINERIANSGEVIGLYERILRGAPEADQAANLAYAHLKLSGLVKRDEAGLLVPRNRIYQRLFNREWVEKSKPQMALTRARRVARFAVATLLVAVISGGYYYVSSVLPLQRQQEARQALEKLQVTLSKDARGFTVVGLPDQSKADVLKQALPHLQALGGDANSLALEVPAQAGFDLSMLGQLTGLRRLVISDPKFSDTGALAPLAGLQELDISATAVTDLAPLAGLTGLQRLSAAMTAVGNLAPLSRLDRLEVLELSDTPVTDLTPLAKLVNLRQVDLSNTRVVDLTPLSTLVRLEELDISRTAVIDLAPLKNLPVLRHLAIDGLGIRGFILAGVNGRVLEDPPSASAGAALLPGDSFRDCPQCPQMAVVPAGSFDMGSPKSEPGRFEDEAPQHKVTVPKAVAVARHEVRFDEWALCVKDGVCPALSDSGFGRGARPAINVSWDEATAYAAWLSKKSGKPYRLLSEAEWEYAARAGTATARYWGENPDQACEYANVVDKTAQARIQLPADWTIHNCSDGFAYAAPVGSFRPNGFGLYDLIGNAWEWVADCYGDYGSAPTDGSPWMDGECNSHVLRGGGWDDLPGYARSARRYWISPGRRDDSLGFRLARTLP
ncbi:MAG: hypothetical protein DVS81_09680 [Candidatus Accumulibacter meliphilus]|jgi:formylglycine-generating enzyme required for sulfatase activity|uniref:Sulfatase-modifying factor enzyme-like domain-containing protein n=1 Tax=Candidatus Accumulibacter meliphilus TaxID=2211374 RepID=A0A369XQM4_9PROT|nr:MAG: hypothetical protein DVS81_09680 [Candidatus Accumulibacter meliphilus]